ncbi:MAG TPA: hypothetical protein VJO35_03785 [Terriglobales bacterium]|nr:hypothetical protein [Terriglobales bacterium]
MKKHRGQVMDGKKYPNYERVPITGLKKSRKGKHHELLGKIMEDLREAPPNVAVRIPLSSIEGVSVLNLRSAIVRASTKEDIPVSTSSDDRYFYVWKAND